MRNNLVTAALAGLLAAVGCDKPDNAKATTRAEAGREAAPVSNRIDIPPAVRQNLGITFAKVGRRRVASTIRVPGRFELLPSARREYRSTLSGWVQLLVKQYDDVQKGADIYQMDSPDWHRLKKQLHEDQSAIEKATAGLAVAEQMKLEAEKAVGIIEKRIEALAGAEVRKAELEAELATRRNSLPRLQAEIKVKEAELREARHDFTLDLNTVGSLLGMSSDFLTKPFSEGDEARHGEHKVQQWYAIHHVGLAATEPGVVESLAVTNGAWVEQNTLVATVVNPAAVRFRAVGLQTDLGRLKDGLDVRIVPPQGGGIDPQDGIAGKLKIGLAADADQRTIDLVVAPEKTAPWARPGVSAMLEIYLEDSAQPELAIPTSAIVQDGLHHVFFRRDPANPDKAIRVEADLGINDGKWAVVKSGVAEGDEVVLDGVYELKLTGGGIAQGGGHFHADGTWHPDGTPEPN